jgi:flagellar hook protein FlgE
MTVLSAMNVAVSGLQAQSTSLSNISANVANASTVGYKKAETDFESLVFGGTTGQCGILGGVATNTRIDVSMAGPLEATGVATDIAINGNGFLVVNTSSASGTGEYLLTRAGSFRPDANGNLVNANGLYLQGEPLAAVGGTGTGLAASISALSTVNVANLAATAAPTTEMTFTANLPSSATAYSTAAAQSFSSDMTYYDALGSAQTMRFQFTPTVPDAEGSAATNTWTMDILDLAASATNPVGSATLLFNPTGATAGTLASVTSLGSGAYDVDEGTYTVATASGTTLPITIGTLGSATGMTQFDASYQTTRMAQDGAAYGSLQSVSIGDDGVVNANFSNGTARAIYQLDLVSLPNPDGLIPVSGSAFRLSQDAGQPQLHRPGDGTVGTTRAGALEGSNVDLTAQLTNMIETQRAYSSNAMVVQTASAMLDTVNRLNA